MYQGKFMNLEALGQYVEILWDDLTLSGRPVM